jgi:hypothetical protein
MKTLLTIFSCLLIGASLTHAQAIKVSQSTLALSVTTGTIAGGMTVVSNSVTTFSYKRMTVLSKISVQTSCPNQKFTLSVQATSPNLGSSAGIINLVNGMAAADLIVSVSGTSGNGSTYHTATLAYKAASTFAQGNSTELGNDTFTITYTQTAQ